jgi:hypothetical protein
MATEPAGDASDLEFLRAFAEKVWGRETVVRLKFERFEAALGDLKVELDGDLRIKVVLGERSRAPREPSRPAGAGF